VRSVIVFLPSVRPSLKISLGASQPPERSGFADRVAEPAVASVERAESCGVVGTGTILKSGCRVVERMFDTANGAKRIDGDATTVPARREGWAATVEGRGG
jgi:hypothetical protein